ncbi:hypothetical protein PAXINDRAFT_14903 [Paxillus involutus ATCC 200175]|uniref:Unplaced genomic scaffold PAXINscaffold_44, whole genome shotgun sequence n=1 Tax=Paxillus involutus ATCC 200175 TaxID=664439 RepID=A0A0C9STS3_PAXIN|nr:hypothetical protein PAXINDRAFT_14903 [Paxillus involutus ATCC 200175]
MPPGYKPRDRSPPSDFESESYPTSAKTPSQFSTKRTDGPDLEALGSDRDPECRFGRQVSNEWNFYPSDTNSRSSVTSSHSSTYPPARAPRQDIYSRAYSHPAGPAPLRESSSENDNQVTALKKDKRHLEHKVTKLEIKVASLEGELASANKLYKQLLEHVDGLGAESVKNVPSSHLVLNPFMSLLKDIRDADSAPYYTKDTLPKLVYWSKAEYVKDWQNGRGYVRTKHNPDSGTVGFLEDENGQIVDKEEQQRMRDHQHSLCYTLLTYDLAPTSWGKCPDIAREFLMRSM